MTDRRYWVDYAKAIGIVLVVYGHVARGVHNAGLPFDNDVFRLADSIVYSFHMPLFFFLSGLFFYDSLTRRGQGGLLLNKVDTIVYPFLIWSLLQGSVEVLMARYTSFDASFGDVLALLWSPRAQFWFLYALFFIFVLCTLLYSLFSRAWTAVLLLLFAALFIIKEQLHFGLIADFIFANTVFFLLGIGFDSLKSFFLSYCWQLALVLGLAFVAAQYGFHWELGLTYDSGGVPGLMLAVVSILFIAAVAMCLSRWRFELLLQLGGASMGIYLMHVLAGSGVRIILAHLFGVQNAALHLVLGTLLGLALPMLALRLIARYRLQWLLQPPPAWSATRLGERLGMGRRTLRF